MPIIANLDDRDQNIPDVFLPEHLRLSATAGNWPAYKHAVETVCRLKGVAKNLTLIRAFGGAPEDDHDGGRDSEDWRARDELCKAIITLNVKGFPAYGVPAGEGVHAREVWTRLVDMHRPKRTCWGLTEWVRAPTRVEWVLLWLLLAALLLLGQPHGQCEMRTPVRIPPPLEYYCDLLRDYHSDLY